MEFRCSFVFFLNKHLHPKNWRLVRLDPPLENEPVLRRGVTRSPKYPEFRILRAQILVKRFFQFAFFFFQAAGFFVFFGQLQQVLQLVLGDGDAPPIKKKQDPLTPFQAPASNESYSLVGKTEHTETRFKRSLLLFRDPGAIWRKKTPRTS